LHFFFNKKKKKEYIDLSDSLEEVAREVWKVENGFLLF
jgi:hypothetical protein